MHKFEGCASIILDDGIVAEVRYFQRQPTLLGVLIGLDSCTEKPRGGGDGVNIAYSDDILFCPPAKIQSFNAIYLLLNNICWVAFGTDGSRGIAELNC